MKNLVIGILRKYIDKSRKYYFLLFFKAYVEVVECKITVYSLGKGSSFKQARYFEKLCGWKEIEIIEGNVQAGHVHMVVLIPAKYSVPETVGPGEARIKKYIKFQNIRIKSRAAKVLKLKMTFSGPLQATILKGWQLVGEKDEIPIDHIHCQTGIVVSNY